MSTTDITDDQYPMIISVGEYRRLKGDKNLTVTHVDNKELVNQLREVLEWIPSMVKTDTQLFQFHTRSYIVRVDSRGGETVFHFRERNG